MVTKENNLAQRTWRRRKKKTRVRPIWTVKRSTKRKKGTKKKKKEETRIDNIWDLVFTNSCLIVTLLLCVQSKKLLLPKSNKTLLRLLPVVLPIARNNWEIHAHILLIHKHIFMYMILFYNCNPNSRRVIYITNYKNKCIIKSVYIPTDVEPWFILEVNHHKRTVCSPNRCLFSWYTSEGQVTNIHINHS